MGKLLYIATTSADGFVADAQGNLDWGAPGEERHLFINDLIRRAGTLVMGRRMYDTMVVWEDRNIVTGASAAMADFYDIWHGADKVVFSRSLQSPRSARTRILRELNPESIHEVKAASSKELTIGGPEVAAQAMKAGLVDEIHLFVVPVLLGSGNRAFRDGVESKLELFAEHRFDDGTVYSAYSVGA